MADSGVVLGQQADSSILSIRDDKMELIPGLPEPDAKRCKLEKVSEPPLEERLTGILCCVVCLDLPNLQFYQCTNGHLMCTSCLSHLLADSRIKDENATCPQCRCEINKNACVRNLAVEKAISELPVLCGFCSKQLPQSALANHERDICQDRPVQCTYARLGCQWNGKFCMQQLHESSCAFPKKCGLNILDSVQQIAVDKDKEVRVYKHIYDMLSYEKVLSVDLQLRPYRTDEYIPKLFYESSRFSAHNCQWSVKARVNDNQDNPLHTVTRTLSYQLCLKTKPTSALQMSYVVLKGPFGETPVAPIVYDFEFTGDSMESTYREFPLPGSNECNKMLAAKIINMRLILIQLPSD